MEAGYFELSMQLRGVPAGSMVVAPEKIARWVPVLHRHPFVASIREGYLRQIEIELGAEEVDRRMNMSEQVSAHPPRERSILRTTTPGARRRSRHEDPVGLFREGLSAYDVRGVCIHRTAQHYGPIVQSLRDAGFELKFDFDRLGYQTWIRPRGSGPEAPPSEG